MRPVKPVPCPQALLLDLVMKQTESRFGNPGSPGKGGIGGGGCWFLVFNN